MEQSNAIRFFLFFFFLFCAGPVFRGFDPCANDVHLIEQVTMDTLCGVPHTQVHLWQGRSWLFGYGVLRVVALYLNPGVSMGRSRANPVDGFKGKLGTRVL